MSLRRNGNGLNPGCGQGGWFPDEESATTRAHKVTFIRGEDDPPVFSIVPCTHGKRGGVHLVEAPDPGEPPSGFSRAVRRMIRIRAGLGDPHDALCEGCGLYLGAIGGELQHRDARGMGGSKDPVVNGLAGGLLLCGSVLYQAGCHWLAETRSKVALRFGLWLENGQDPRDTPVRLYGVSGGKRDVWLAEDEAAYLDDPPRRLAA